MSGDRRSDERLGRCRTGYVAGTAHAAWPWARLTVYADRLVLDGAGLAFIAAITGKPKRLVLPAGRIHHLQRAGWLGFTLRLTDAIHGTIKLQGPSVAPTVAKLAAQHRLRQL